MSLKCPVCNVVNEASVHCRRCRADLSMLLAVQRQARQRLAESLRRFLEGDPDSAEQSLLEAEQLHSSVETARLRGLLALFRRDFSGAWHSYLLATDRQSSGI